MEHEKECYVFSSTADNSPTAQRRRKKRVRPNPFSPLMRGSESDRSIESRYKMFQYLWQPQEDALMGIIDDANTKTIKALRSFVISTSESGQVPNVPTGLILQGPENITFTGFYDVLCKDLTDLEHILCIKLTAGQNPNLKTVLRYVNQAATVSTEEQNESNDEANRKLNYDLQTLHNHVKRESVRRVVLLFEDSEAFEGGLLSDLIYFLKLWNDRVPFLLLFGIATSLGIFQTKLSRNAMKCLDGKIFGVEPVDIEHMFKAVHSKYSRLFIGPGLSKLIIERQRRFISNAQSLIQVLKYAYMAHAYTNPLSIWLDPFKAPQPPDQETVKFVRQLPSFRRYLQQLIDAGQYVIARKLLDDDVELCNFLMPAAHNSLKALRDLMSTIDLLFALKKALNSHYSSSDTTWSEIYILAMSNKLSGSDLFKETLSTWKRLNSNVLQDCLKHLQQEEWINSDPDLRLVDSATDLTDLRAQLSEHTILRSAHDIQFSSLRTKIVAQKIELGRYSAQLVEEETSYTKIVDKFVSKVELFFGSRLFNPQNSFLYEVFVYDMKRLHREAFMPNPRFSIERALSSPHDYLGCTCCYSTAEGLLASQPAIAIVYKLYLESGNVINTADLWSAFRTIIGTRENEDNDDEREKALTLFSKALAELKYLGLCKNSRKKIDHLAKLAWKGL